MKTLVITGGSSGIGKSTVDLFVQKGYRVFELSRHGKSSQGVEHLDCDVTRVADCKQAMAQIIELCGKIDVLISNAGMGISGAVEFTDPTDMQRQLDVNFFGAVQIVQAVLPYMRQAGEGRIVFVSSLAAIFAIPFQAFYSASKAALVSFAMALQNEVRPFGIKVTCMLPGDVKTGFTASRQKSTLGSEVYHNMKSAVEHMEHDETHGIEPEQIAQKILEMSECKSPAMLNTVGFQYKLFLLLQKVIPTTLACRIVGKLYAPF